jgi:hypothetical protein
VIRPVALGLAAALTAFSFQTPSAAPVRGLTAATEVRRAYDAILDADFARLPAELERVCGPAPREVCAMLDALGQWWQIAIEPESRLRDVTLDRLVADAIARTSEWTGREPQRAEAWFYLGAAYGVRVQWRVLRQERLAAARDGKRIKAALDRALALDPSMHDAEFGRGLYRYYADIAPSAFKILRWLLLLPAGDRAGGLREIVEARDRGLLVPGEADYQLHLIYLWYEKRSRDALTILQGLQARYPMNPLFRISEAEIQDVYFHDHAASYASAARLLTLAESQRINDPALAAARARLQMAIELDHLGDHRRATDMAQSLIATNPPRPYGITIRAQTLLKSLTARATK